MSFDNKSEVLNPNQTGKLISSKSKDVKLCDEAVKTAAVQIGRSFLSKETSLKNWKSHALHPSVANEAVIDFIFAVDTLNFSFWPDDPDTKFSIKYDGVSYTGYWSLVAALKRAEDKGHPVFSAFFMATVESEEFEDIFKSDSKADVPLLMERYLAYTDAGKVLQKKFNGSFVNCVKSCGKDALKLLDCIVENFQSYRDTSEFDGQQVSFYKRAQIVVADIWCCFEGKGLGEFSNIDQLTMFADYRVPQTLEFMDILSYSPTLKEVLQNLTVLSPGSRYELEIRGCSIEAVARLVDHVRTVIMASDVMDKAEIARIVNSITVDNYLWDFARAHRKEMSHLAFHRVRTIYY